MIRRRDASAYEGISAYREAEARRAGAVGLQRLLVAALSFGLLCFATAAPAGIARSSLFGTTEVQSLNLNTFPKWSDALARFAEELRSCAEPDCRIDEWNRLVSSLRGRDVPTQLRLLNAYVNRHPYVDDRINWHQPDYWATPLQFLARSGDCEDFAIAKYLVLRELGTALDDMRIVIVQDRARGVAHAVLAVYIEGRALILDNQRNDIVAADRISNYVPVYSLNERGWWLHQP